MGAIVSKSSQDRATSGSQTVPSPTSTGSYLPTTSAPSTSASSNRGRTPGNDETEQRLPSPDSPSSPLPELTTTLAEDVSNDEQPMEEERGKTASRKRTEMIEKCLGALETGYELTFEREQLLASVQEIQCRPGETIMTAGQGAAGVYVVEEGALDVLSPENGVLLSLIDVGEFCGELSTFFRIPCTATVMAHRTSRTRVLLLPMGALSQSSGVQQVPMHRLLHWCSERSYVSTGALFDKTKANLLTKILILNCLKVAFPTWSTDAMDYIASKSRPLLFNSGDVLCDTAEELSFCLLILRGSIEMSDELSDGTNRMRIHSSHEGYCVGKEILEGSRTAKTVTAVSPVLAVPVPLDLLKDAFNQFPR